MIHAYGDSTCGDHALANRSPDAAFLGIRYRGRWAVRGISEAETALLVVANAQRLIERSRFLLQESQRMGVETHRRIAHSRALLRRAEEPGSPRVEAYRDLGWIHR
jgi:hypothetical protein